MPQRITPAVSRTYKCQCGRPVFFRNTQCVICGSQLGFITERLTVVALVPETAPDLWRIAGDASGTAYRCCANRLSASACNWMVRASADALDPDRADPPLCLACQLTRGMFDVSGPAGQHRWLQLETAKRRLVAQLLTLGLPVEPRGEGDDGIAFDLLEATQPGECVLTGHANGVITVNAAEADDARREAIRTAMREPYRTLLGHFRHEIGHYYWDRLVRDDPARLAQFRALFGDERQDYGKALQRHYRDGPAPCWALTYLTSYASAHPWEDWAETWAHYLHMTDTLDAAASFDIDALHAESESDPFEARHLWDPQHPGAQDFLGLLNSWVELTQVMNELTRSMGQPDCYPFILPYRAVGKLQFIHETIRAQRAQAAPVATDAALA
ncbi:putative zinc-binding metallopeptidase [Pseudorhodoferax sp. Leaf267]|uniref:zinc-binding metallopeptidase family protein n=1 Tax=Pseudorhodoferax sp. Leaf267 TaxID=1736316 RepID=UPI000AD73135|nr:putative zinc-binding metallopeptidase [Pseudorhodoferax sp. Leaf267]